MFNITIKDGLVAEGHTVESSYQVVHEMTLAPDGMYHGLCGNGREILVSPQAIAGTLEVNLANEEYPGQGHFQTHAPDTWIGAIESGVYQSSDVRWADETASNVVYGD